MLCHLYISSSLLRSTHPVQLPSFPSIPCSSIGVSPVALSHGSSCSWECLGSNAALCFLPTRSKHPLSVSLRKGVLDAARNAIAALDAGGGGAADSSAAGGNGDGDGDGDSDGDGGSSYDFSDGGSASDDSDDRYMTTLSHPLPII